MPQYNEQVSSHLPAIHEDTYTWNEFIDLLKQTEGETYETDKIYFIQDVDTSANLMRKLTAEILAATEELKELLNSSFEQQENNEENNDEEEEVHV